MVYQRKTLKRRRGGRRRKIRRSRRVKKRRYRKHRKTKRRRRHQRGGALQLDLLLWMMYCGAEGISPTAGDTSAVYPTDQAIQSMTIDMDGLYHLLRSIDFKYTSVQDLASMMRTADGRGLRQRDGVLDWSELFGIVRWEASAPGVQHLRRQPLDPDDVLEQEPIRGLKLWAKFWALWTKKIEGPRSYGFKQFVKSRPTRPAPVGGPPQEPPVL